MMKVTFLLDNLLGGGTEKTLIEILNNLNYKNIDVELILLTREGKYVKDINKNVKVKYIFDFDNKSRISIFLQKAIRKILFFLICKLNLKFVCKLIIKNSDRVYIAFMEGISTKIISGLEVKKKIAWIHTNMNEYNWYKKYFLGYKDELNAYRNYNKIICVSNTCKNSFLHLYGDEFKERVVTIYNPINYNDILIKSKEEISDIDIDEKQKYLCFIGRLEPEKGIDRLINCIKELKNFNFTLLIIGDGSLKEVIVNKIRENKLENKIKLLGFKENPYKYMNISNIIVSPSFFEGFSLITAEALILNKVILATDSGGPTELLNNGDYGIVCENTEEGLLEGLKEILTNEDKYFHYQNVDKHIINEFEIKTVIKRIEEILRKVAYE